MLEEGEKSRKPLDADAEPLPDLVSTGRKAYVEVDGQAYELAEPRDALPYSELPD